MQDTCAARVGRRPLLAASSLSCLFGRGLGAWGLEGLGCPRLLGLWDGAGGED